MSQDKNMRDRVAGRDRVARLTVWRIEVGGMRVRCVRSLLGGVWAVELSLGTSSGSTNWVEVDVGVDPVFLFERATRLPSIQGELRRRADETSKEWRA